MAASDTIAAIATAPGFGGVGIVRISGSLARPIAVAILGTLPPPRYATFASFRDAGGEPIDQGLALYFPSPNSFTGEDVLELQGHGGPVVLDMLLRRTLQLGARLARPGEFSERAFLNGKVDLAQAEAIADLIESSTETAVRLANRTLEGTFSRRIHALVDAVTQLRLYVEAAIDFPEEEIDFLAEPRIDADIHALIQRVREILQTAQQGRLIREGLRLVIAGAPNAGKSSLLNALSGTESAIVTDLPGTTRDLIREQIQLDGMPLHIVDTAGLHESEDPVEQEGMRRARVQIDRADRVLWLFDDRLDPDHRALNPTQLPPRVPLTLVRNKIDLTGTPPGVRHTPHGTPEIALSATSGAGIDLLKQHLRQIAGLHGAGEGEFLARRRHLDALQRALSHLQRAGSVLAATAAGELMAEDLRQAQKALGEITGEVSSDDLLGRIFNSFCIGK